MLINNGELVQTARNLKVTLNDDTKYKAKYKSATIVPKFQGTNALKFPCGSSAYDFDELKTNGFAQMLNLIADNN